MNELFVNVKVDREERPDVDAVYMDAVQAMTGRGGWPMTVFLTPDGRPFFGGTYFPQAVSFLQLLAAIDDAWRTRRDELRRAAPTSSPRRSAGPPGSPPATDAARRRPPQRARSQQLGAAVRPAVGRVRRGAQVPADDEPRAAAAGPRAQPAPATALQVVTTSPRRHGRPAASTTTSAAASPATRSTSAGWCPTSRRCSTTRRCWPGSTCTPGRSPARPRYRQVVEETIDYVLRDLRHAGRRLLLGRGRRLARARRASSTSGRPAQVDAVARRRSSRRRRSSGTASPTGGNFEGRTILTPPGARRPARARRRSSGPGALLFDARAEPGPARARRQGAHRVERADARRPGRGRRRARAATTGSTRPRANAEFLLAEPAPRRRPLAALVAGRRRGRATLAYAADHAALVDAFTRLAEATGEARWIDEARADGRRAARPVLGRRAAAACSPPADDAEALIARQKDLLDNATPSANSHGGRSACSASAALTGEERYRAPGRADPAAARPGRRRRTRRRSPTCSPPSTCGAAGIDRDRRRRRPARPACAAVHARYLPNAVLAWGERYDSPLWEDRRARARLRLPRLRLPGARRLGRGPGRSARGLST